MDEDEEGGEGLTSDGDVGDAVLASDVDGVGNDAVQGFSDHGEIGGALEELEGGRGGVKAVLEEEVDGSPWEAPEPLHTEPQPQQSPDPPPPLLLSILP